MKRLYCWIFGHRLEETTMHDPQGYALPWRGVECLRCGGAWCMEEQQS